MKVTIRERPWDLIVVSALTFVLLLVIAAFPNSTARTILGLPYILFFPGYALISFLFPEEAPIDKLERLALSFGLSIAIVPLIGLLLNYVWEISLVPILYSTSLFIFAFCLLAYLRRNSIPMEERLSYHVEINPPDWQNYDIIDKALVVATVGLLIASGGLAYHIATTPRTGERFTEFYILGPEGMADDYPTNLTVNESGEVIVGAVNREHRNMDYTLLVRSGSTRFNSTQELRDAQEDLGENESLDLGLQFDNETRLHQMSGNYNISLSTSDAYHTNFTLSHDQNYTHRLNFTLDEPGLYMVQFLLFKSDSFTVSEEKAYRELHLWVTVEG